MDNETIDRQEAWRAIIVPFAASRLFIFLVGAIAISLGTVPDAAWRVSRSPWLDLWARWDSGYYLSIASNGYRYIPGEMTNVAFFPLYPVILRLLTLGSKSWLALAVVGTVLSHAFTLLAFYLLYRLVRLDDEPAVARRTVWFLAFFPASFFLSMVYTEALFLLLTVAAFYLVRRRQWLPAAVLGGLSALTRSIGFLLIVPLAVEWWQQRPLRWRRLLLLLLIPAGLLIFMVYLQLVFGQPLLFINAQGSWGREIAPLGLQERLHYLFVEADLWSSIRGNLVDILFAGAGLILFAVALWRLRPSYVLYIAYGLGVPLATLQVFSMPRLLVVIFPLFILLARYLRHRRLVAAVLAGSAVLLAYFVVRWSLWLWVA